MVKNMKYAAAAVCFAFLALFALYPASGQTIALHPLKGVPDAAKNFFNEIIETLREFPRYTPYLINLHDDETLDVATGGWPAYLCPQDILTKGAPFAITGEVTGVSGFQGRYEVRLYLWDMEYHALVYSDEIIVYEGETEEKNLPQLLAWMLSWIDRYKAAGPEREIVYIERPVIIYSRETAPETQYWLRFGFRIGGGDSQWRFSIAEDAEDKRESVLRFLNGSASLYAAIYLTSWFAIQPEVNFGVDISRPWNPDATEGSFYSAYLTTPLLFKFSWYRSSLMASIYIGPYFYLPLFRTENEQLGDRFSYNPQIPGVVFGGSIGWKLGRGHFFVDARFEYDGHLWSAPAPDNPSSRTVARLSIGYEVPLLQKKARAPSEREIRRALANAIEVVPDIPEDELPPPDSDEESPDTDEELPAPDTEEDLPTTETGEEQSAPPETEKEATPAGDLGNQPPPPPSAAVGN